ncbi:MAG: chromate transporter [Sphaerochaetaceae bacterium]|jgi:chromate transporter
MEDQKLADPSQLSKAKLFWTLFSTTFTLSAFTFGGGYVIVPLMREAFVEKLRWVDENEMIDLIAIAQSAPGPIAVNTSIHVGYKIARIPGALFTLLGSVLPPLITLTIISYIYYAIRDNKIVQTLFFGMSVGVAVVILDAVIMMAKTVFKQKDFLSPIIMVVAFVTIYFFKVNVVLIIFGSAIVGAIAHLVFHKGGKR